MHNNLHRHIRKIGTKSNYHFRYEQGLEDYEEAVARVEKMKETNNNINQLGTLMSLFSTLNTAWTKANAKPADTSRALAETQPEIQPDIYDETAKSDNGI